MAIKVEDKLRKKGDSSSKNRGIGKDFGFGERGDSSGMNNEKRSYEDSKWNEQANKTSQRGHSSREEDPTMVVEANMETIKEVHTSIT